MDNKVRLQKYIAECGICSRRAAEELISSGLVIVNGEKVTELGTKIDPEHDIVSVDRALIKREETKYYVMLNKPKGYITTAKDQFGRKNVTELLSGFNARLYPVGRLDYDSEGLLILTNDGELTYKITHPKHELYKTYIAEVMGILDKVDTDKLRMGINIEGQITLPAKVYIKSVGENRSEAEISIREGRNRQIRRMFEAIGHRVVRLKRIRIGNITLGDLKTGEYRLLTKEEVQSLKEKL